jgi:small conductance mechanosensitive channel
MWEWFTVNAAWILIVSAVILLVLLLTRHQFKEAIKKAIPNGWHRKLDKAIDRAYWGIEVITLAVLVTAVVAIIISKAGIAATVTQETIQRWFLEHGITILIILLVGIALWLVLKRFLPPLLSSTMVKAKGESKEGIKKRTDTLVSVFLGMGKILIIIIALLMVLSEFGISIGPILAGLGIAGLAISFGAQYLIRDLIAGIFVIFENQYRVGDVAKVADIAGIVEEINLRKTVLRDLDGIVHHVPNGEIRVASNYTRHFARVNLNVSVGYGTDLDQAISVINRVGQELAADDAWSKLIISAPQVLRVDNLGDSGIDIKILGDVRPLQQWAVTGELRKRIKKTFDEEGIEIPWPHIKLYFGQSQPATVTCQACSYANLPDSKFCSNCGASLIQT